MTEFYDSSKIGEKPKYFLINTKALRQNHLFSNKEDLNDWAEINEKHYGLECNEIGEIEDLKNYKIVNELDTCGGNVRKNGK